MIERESLSNYLCQFSLLIYFFVFISFIFPILLLVNRYFTVPSSLHSCFYSFLPVLSLSPFPFHFQCDCPANTYGSSCTTCSCSGTGRVCDQGINGVGCTCGTGYVTNYGAPTTCFVPCSNPSLSLWNNALASYHFEFSLTNGITGSPFGSASLIGSGSYSSPTIGGQQGVNGVSFYTGLGAYVQVPSVVALPTDFSFAVWFYGTELSNSYNWRWLLT
jgi:hypothetical protein